MKQFLKNNWALIAILIYVISPIDIIPEGFIPFAGYIEDVGLLSFELLRRYYIYRHSPDDPEAKDNVEIKIPWVKLALLAVLLTIILMTIAVIGILGVFWVIKN